MAVAKCSKASSFLLTSEVNSTFQKSQPTKTLKSFTQSKVGMLLQNLGPEQTLDFNIALKNMGEFAINVANFSIVLEQVSRLDYDQS